MHKIFFRLAMLSGFGFSTLAHGVDWNQLLDQGGGKVVTFGVELAGDANYQRNLSVPFAPASNSKMFTAAMAMDRLGAKFTYPTVVQWTPVDDQTAANLRIIGYGDPSWGLSELGETYRTRIDFIAKALVAQGLRQVRGEVTALSSDPLWEVLRFPDGWEVKDGLTCEGSLAQAFNVGLNCGTFVVNALNAGHWSEVGLNEPVEVQLQSGKVNRFNVALVNPAEPQRGFIVRGTLKRKGSGSFRLPVFSAKDWVRGLLIAALKAQGVQFLAPLAEPETFAPVIDRQMNFMSPTLATIFKPMLKNSINFLADGIFKTVGLHFATGGPADLVTAGQQVLRDYLLGIGVPNEFTLHDGAGLSRTSRISPRAMLAFLNYLKARPEFSAIWNALPVAGVDGTLRNRMKGTVAQNRLRGKTGTLDGVYNLSGFVPTKGDFIPFVLLSHTRVAHAQTARSAEDRVGVRLSGLVKASSSFTPEFVTPFPYVPEHAGQDDQ